MPDLDMDMKFENVHLKALNDFFGAYASVDIEKGSFNLYSEVAVKDGHVTGYVKPLLIDLKIVNWKDDKQKPVQLVWESIVGFVVEVFENQPENQFATRIPLDGQTSSVESDFWPTLWNIFRNAFVEAFERNTDNTITIASTAGDKSAAGKTKKELRKEKREKKRDERRARKEERKKGEKSGR